MQPELKIPAWAMNSKSDFLKFTTQYCALHIGDGCSVSSWAESCGISANAVFTAIRRGYFSIKMAEKLVSVVPGGVADPLWLVSPDRFMSDAVCGASDYGD